MAEPVTLAEAKAQCRVLHSEEDGLITALIAAAREWVENNTGRILVQRQVTDTASAFPAWFELSKGPAVSITSVQYRDVNGATQNLDTTGLLLMTGDPARLYHAMGTGWPAIGYGGQVVVTYLAGYGASAVPASLKQAVLMLIGHWYANRQAATTETVSEVPIAVESLCGQYRRPGV